MSSKKLLPEEELEKQYQDYKAQFEQWKERNSESVGTDAYMRYVKQFEDWEKDVEKRRAVVRQKADQERLALEQENRKLEAERQRKRNEEMEAVQQQQQTENQTTQQQKTSDLPPIEMSSMANVMQQMLNFVMVTENQNGDAINENNINHEMNSYLSQMQSHLHSVQAQPSHQLSTEELQATTSDPQNPPQLWGTDGATYLTTDPMFRRWNVRAAPPNFCVQYEPPPPTIITSPYWLLAEKMKSNKLVLAPNYQQPPPAAAIYGGPSIPNVISTVLPSQLSLHQSSISLNTSGRTIIGPPSSMPPPHILPLHMQRGNTGGVIPPMFNVPPPNFRMPPPPSAVSSGHPSQMPFYKIK